MKKRKVLLWPVCVFVCTFPFSEAMSVEELPAQGGRYDWQTYRNERYGFEVQYPKDREVTENGPNAYELQLLGGQELISGTQAPLLETIEVKNEEGEIILTIDIPDQSNFPIVSGDYDWWLRPCGQEGFAEITAKTKILFANYKTLKVTSVFEEFKNPSRHTTYYYCVNVPPNPVVISYSEEWSKETNQILATFKFRP